MGGGGGCVLDLISISPVGGSWENLGLNLDFALGEGEGERGGEEIFENMSAPRFTIPPLGAGPCKGRPELVLVADVSHRIGPVDLLEAVGDALHKEW